MKGCFLILLFCVLSEVQITLFKYPTILWKIFNMNTLVSLFPRSAGGSQSDDPFAQAQAPMARWPASSAPVLAGLCLQSASSEPETPASLCPPVRNKQLGRVN